MVHFDPSMTSYEKMLDVFWEIHDPTKLRSKQYMSAIFYHDDRQKLLAEKSREKQQKLLPKPIVTEILEVGATYLAEK